MRKELSELWVLFVESDNYKKNAAKGLKTTSLLQNANKSFKDKKLTEKRAVGLMWQFSFISITKKIT